MINPEKLAHLVLRTSKLPEIIELYKKLLNATTTFENKILSFITCDDKYHRVAFINIPDIEEAPPKSLGVYHFAFTYSSRAQFPMMSPLNNRVTIGKQGISR